jgi:mRNA-degrading endonuclease toxin of MazEF toxin-antitoxin module
MNRGEIVEVDWPFTDLTGSKPRPAVVVQADYLNGLIDDTVYIKIQGTPYGIPGTEVRIDPTVESSSGLSKVCYASCKDILTREQALVLGVVGVLSDATMRQIENCLKQVLGIP